MRAGGWRPVSGGFPPLDGRGRTVAALVADPHVLLQLGSGGVLVLHTAADAVSALRAPGGGGWGGEAVAVAMAEVSGGVGLGRVPPRAR